MRSCRGVATVGVLLATLAAPDSARAQAATGEPDASDSKPGEYLWAVGASVGIVQPDTDSEAYWSANLRRRVGARATEGASDSGRPPEGLKAYVEGEVGYWKQSTATTEDKDLLLGANLIGAVPTHAADIYIGVGFGAHFTDETLVTSSGRSTVSKTRFGGNLQFGVEARVSEHFGLFGVGRIDLVSGDRNRQQTKVSAGVRYRF